MPALESLNAQLQSLNHSLTWNLHSSTGPRPTSDLSALRVRPQMAHMETMGQTL